MASKRKIPKLVEVDEGSSDEEEEASDVEDKGKSTRIKASSVHDEFTRAEENISKKRRKSGTSANDVQEDIETVSKCNHCSSKYVGKNPTTLKEHLKTAHRKIYDEVIKKDEEKKKAKKESERKSRAKSSSGLKKASAALFKPSPLDKFLGRSQSAPPMPKSKAQQVERKLAYWVGTSTLPVNFVENPAFEHFIQGLDIQVKAPSKDKLRKLINQMAGEVKEKITEALGQARKVSVTTDIWSSKGCINSFLGITTHSYNPSTRKKENYRVSCRVFDVKHSGKNIAKMMKRILMEYDIESKTNRITLDNASNGIKAVQELNEMEIGEENESFDNDDSDDEVEAPNLSDGEDDDNDDENGMSSCDEEPEDEEEEDQANDELIIELEEEENDRQEAFAFEEFKRNKCVVHTIQLPICKVLKSKRSSFGRVLRKSKKYVVKYRRSSKAKAILRKTSFKLRLKGWVKTRWWSEIEMAQRIVMAAESEGEPLAKLSDKMGWTMEINQRDVSELKSYVEIMSPFMEIGSRLGAEKLSTIHLVYPMITELLQQLEMHIEKKNHATFCMDLLTEMKKYFAFLLDPTSVDFDPLYVTATYLSPVYKLSLADNMKEIAIKNLKELVENEKKKDDGDMEVVEENGNMEAQSEPTENQNISLPGLKLLSSKILNSNSNNNNANNKKEDCFASDVKVYEAKSSLHLEKLNNKAIVAKKKESATQSTTNAELEVMDPLDYWIKEERTKEYITILPQIAEDLLAIPASSVPSERMFSLAGLGLISPNNLEQRVLIKCNPNLN